MKILDVPQSGSVAGVTSSHNRFGQYRRTKAMPTQPRTSKQQLIRSGLIIGSSGWRYLTDAQRTAWADYAAQIQRSDSLGSGYQPTGASLYAGSVVLQPGGTVTDPPSVLPEYVLSVINVSYTGPSPGPEAMSLSIQTTSANNFVIIQTSGPVSPGITSAAAVRRWRSLPDTAADFVAKQYLMSASSIAILTQYKYLFPSPPSGSVIWFRVKELFTDGVSAATITNRLWQNLRITIA